jgi:dephospho-CoA kinase
MSNSTNNNMIIGIIGLNGSGKNTIANILQNEFKIYNFVIDSFAKKLKYIFSIFF